MKFTVCLLALFLLSSPLYALDHRNIDLNLPLAVEDAYTLKYREWVWQISGGYRSLEGNADAGDASIELEYGLARDLEIDFGLKLGTRSPGANEQNGNIEIGALYNFNTETFEVPAFSIRGEVELPTGPNDADVSTRLAAIATKSMGFNRIHINAGYLYSQNSDHSTRSHRWEAIAGWDRPIGLHTLLLADVKIFQPARPGNRVASVIEAGIRRQLSPQTVISFGAGFGITGDEERDNFQTQFGFSRSF